MTHHMHNAFIEVIPHKLQRYETSGDWYTLSNGLLHFKISQRSDKKHEWLDAMHEQIEQFICELRGVSQEQVDEWDFAHPGMEDPGSDPKAPYFEGHAFANSICMELAKKIGVDWREYYNEELT